MIKIPKDLNEINEIEEIEVEIPSPNASGHREEALSAINKQVEEKLSKIAGRDDDMEWQLAQIQESRRLEREAIEQSRSEKKPKRRKKWGVWESKASAPQPMQSTQMEQPPMPELSTEPQAIKAEPMLERQLEPQAVKAEPVLEPDPMQRELVQEAWSPTAEEQKDAQVALALDQLYDTAEELQASEVEGEKPSRKLDERIDAFFSYVKSLAKKVAAIGKELHFTRKDMDQKKLFTHEKRMARYKVVWGRHLSPINSALTLWTDKGLIRLAQGRAWLFKGIEDALVKFILLLARLRVWLQKVYKKAWAVLEYAEHHKLRIFSYFGGAVACVALIGVIISSMTAYEYIYNGRVLGVVKNQEDVYKTIDVIGGKLAESLNADIEIDKEKDISFNKIIALGTIIDSKDDVLNSLTYMKSLKAKGYSIVADGKQISILQSREAAQEILDGITARYSQGREGVEYKSIGFAQDVEIKEVNTELGNIQDTEEVTKYMLTGAVEKKVHVVQKGQTFNAIAKVYGMKPSELEASNPGVDIAKLKIDQELVLTQDCPVLTVQTKEIAAYTASIPFDISYEQTDKVYKGDTKIKLKGVEGKRDVVAEVVRNNGVEVSRTELSSKIISQPTNQIVLQGTKAKPKTVATGTFGYPVRGARISSKYGARWGRTHKGIDMAVGRGTPIVAADGGTVTFAGYKGSFGYLVIINHGNGLETYYAHCSKLVVSKGAKVYKGQHIANVGSTGRSTGPHCHFEVHVNGVARNPMNYL